MSMAYYNQVRTSAPYTRTLIRKILDNGTQLNFQYFWFRDDRIVNEEPISDLNEMTRILFEEPEKTMEEEGQPISSYIAWYAGEFFFVSVIHDDDNTLSLSFSPFAYSWRREHMNGQYFPDAYKCLTVLMPLCKDIPVTYVHFVYM